MHDQSLINQFVELRAQGLSIPKISGQISVPTSTLYEWQDRMQPRIQKLKLLLFEQAEQRILGAHKEQYESLAKQLKAVDEQLTTYITGGMVKYVKLSELVRMAGSLRRQMYGLKT